MNVGETKIVEFENWCKSCKYFETPENEDPCEECISQGVRAYSHKPEKWEEKTDV